jgi:putative sensory transduction regulator
VHLAESVEDALRESGVTWRRVAPGEWGLTVPSAGSDLQIGLALRGGLLSVQAEVLPPGIASEHALLRRNRTLRLVRFAHTAAGAVYLQGEVPEVCVTAGEVDRLLGVLVAAAEEVRGAVGWV